MYTIRDGSRAPLVAACLRRRFIFGMNLISGYQSIIIVFKSVYYKLEYDTTDAILSCNLGIDCASTLISSLCTCCKADAVLSCNLGIECKNSYLSFYSVPPVKQMLFFPVIWEQTAQVSTLIFPLCITCKRHRSHSLISCNSGVDCTSTLIFSLYTCQNNYPSLRSVPAVKHMLYFPDIFLATLTKF